MTTVSGLFRHGALASTLVVSLHRAPDDVNPDILQGAASLLADVVAVDEFFSLTRTPESPSRTAFDSHSCLRQVIAENAWRFDTSPTTAHLLGVLETLLRLARRETVSCEALDDTRAFFQALSASMLSGLACVDRD
jgi:hypothetical protein